MRPREEQWVRINAMPITIGIPKETKNEWERRAPLIPADMADLQRSYGLRFLVQPSPQRAFHDEEYRRAGAELCESLEPARLVIGIKEIPTENLRPGKVYLYFAHVVKGQALNMPMLGRLLELGSTLIDYEKIADDQNRRLVFFGRHAGCAGMIDSLHWLGKRLAHEGLATPLMEIQPAHRYGSLAEAKAHLQSLGQKMLAGGLPEAIRPLSVGVAGYGNVSRGAQEILDCLPIEEVAPAQLASKAARRGASSPPFLKTVFHEQDLVRPHNFASLECARDRPKEPERAFVLQDYYAHPELYSAKLEEFLPHLDVLINAVYWEPRYPRFVTRKWAREAYGSEPAPRLRLIGDISCDLGGAIELTCKVTTPAAPVYVWDPRDGSIRDGIAGQGPIILAVDNLPCELPAESSQHFSLVLRGMIPDLAGADWSADFEHLALPRHLKKAVIVHRGALTPGFAYLQQYLPKPIAPRFARAK
jgi:alpha-aminoadipic semialdehyde synthase